MKVTHKSDWYLYVCMDCHNVDGPHFTEVRDIEMHIQETKHRNFEGVQVLEITLE